MQRGIEGDWLAESSLFADSYHCDALAVAGSVVSHGPVGAMRAALDRDAALGTAVARHLAREVQRMRTRTEVLAQRTVADRIDAWLTLQGRDLPARGGWKLVASEIGVSPEALYRELKRRRFVADR